MISKKQSRTTETNFISKISKILGNTRNEITIPEKKKSIEIQTDETIINKFIETAKKQNWLIHQAQSSNNVLTLIENILIKTKAKNIVRTNEEIINRLDLNKYLESKNYKETIIFNKKPLTSEKIKNICSNLKAINDSITHDSSLKAKENMLLKRLLAGKNNGVLKQLR